MVYWLIGYMWLYIHRPFEIWPWLGSLHIERIYMLAMLFCWALFSTKTWTKNRINLGVALLLFSITVSTLLSPFVSFSSLFVQNWFKILLFYVLILSTVDKEEELQILVVAFVCIMALFELHSLYEYFCGRGVYRMGIWRMIGVGTSLSDPNSFAASVNYGIPLLLPVMLVTKTKMRRLAVWACLGLSILCIVLTGSRTGLSGLCLLAFFVGLVSKNRWKIIPLLLIVSCIVWINMPAELQLRFLTLFNPSLGPSNAEVSAESREVFFVIALDLWKANPIFGVGPDGFRYASGVDQPSHTLYAEVISNLGLVGVIALLVLLKGFFVNFFIGRNIYKDTFSPEQLRFNYYVLVAVTVSIFQLLFLGLGGHNLFRFTWLWYGAFSALALRFILIKSEQKS